MMLFSISSTSPLTFPRTIFADPIIITYEWFTFIPFYSMHSTLHFIFVLSCIYPSDRRWANFHSPIFQQLVYVNVCDPSDFTAFPIAAVSHSNNWNCSAKTHRCLTFGNFLRQSIKRCFSLRGNCLLNYILGSRSTRASHYHWSSLQK